MGFRSGDEIWVLGAETKFNVFSMFFSRRKFGGGAEILAVEPKFCFFGDENQGLAETKFRV